MLGLMMLIELFKVKNPNILILVKEDCLIIIEDKFYIVWCDSFFGATISIAYTKDFKKFVSDMDNISKRMEENQRISGELDSETAIFTKI